MEDESKIKDVLRELDHRCPACLHSNSSYVHDYHDKSMVCSKHLLIAAKEFIAGTGCSECLEIMEELKSRGLGEEIKKKNLHVE